MTTDSCVQRIIRGF